MTTAPDTFDRLPASVQALAVLAHAHRLQGDAERAALLFDAADRLHADEPVLLCGLAASELARGRPAQALAALERLAFGLAAAGSPRQQRAFHLLRAQALVGLDRRAEAAAAMRAAADASLTQAVDGALA